MIKTSHLKLFKRSWLAKHFEGEHCPAKTQRQMSANRDVYSGWVFSVFTMSYNKLQKEFLATDKVDTVPMLPMVQYQIVRSRGCEHLNQFPRAAV